MRASEIDKYHNMDIVTRLDKIEEYLASLVDIDIYRDFLTKYDEIKGITDVFPRKDQKELITGAWNFDICPTYKNKPFITDIDLSRFVKRNENETIENEWKFEKRPQYTGGTISSQFATLGDLAFYTNCTQDEIIQGNWEFNKVPTHIGKPFLTEASLNEYAKRGNDEQINGTWEYTKVPYYKDDKGPHPFLTEATFDEYTKRAVDESITGTWGFEKLPYYKKDGKQYAFITTLDGCLTSEQSTATVKGEWTFKKPITGTLRSDVSDENPKGTDVALVKQLTALENIIAAKYLNATEDVEKSVAGTVIFSKTPKVGEASLLTDANIYLWEKLPTLDDKKPYTPTDYQPVVNKYLIEKLKNYVAGIPGEKETDPFSIPGRINFSGTLMYNNKEVGAATSEQWKLLTPFLAGLAGGAIVSALGGYIVYKKTKQEPTEPDHAYTEFTTALEQHCNWIVDSPELPMSFLNNTGLERRVGGDANAKMESISVLHQHTARYDTTRILSYLTREQYPVEPRAPMRIGGNTRLWSDGLCTVATWNESAERYSIETLETVLCRVRLHQDFIPIGATDEFLNPVVAIAKPKESAIRGYYGGGLLTSLGHPRENERHVTTTLNISREGYKAWYIPHNAFDLDPTKGKFEGTSGVIKWIDTSYPGRQMIYERSHFYHNDENNVIDRFPTDQVFKTEAVDDSIDWKTAQNVNFSNFMLKGHSHKNYLNLEYHVVDEKKETSRYDIYDTSNYYKYSIPSVRPYITFQPEISFKSQEMVLRVVEEINDSADIYTAKSSTIMSVKYGYFDMLSSEPKNENLIGYAFLNTINLSYLPTTYKKLKFDQTTKVGYLTTNHPKFNNALDTFSVMENVFPSFALDDEFPLTRDEIFDEIHGSIGYASKTVKGPQKDTIYTFTAYRWNHIPIPNNEFPKNFAISGITVGDPKKKESDNDPIKGGSVVLMDGYGKFVDYGLDLTGNYTTNMFSISILPDPCMMGLPIIYGYVFDDDQCKTEPSSVVEINAAKVKIKNPLSFPQGSIIPDAVKILTGLLDTNPVSVGLLRNVKGLFDPFLKFLPEKLPEKPDDLISPTVGGTDFMQPPDGGGGGSVRVMPVKWSPIDIINPGGVVDTVTGVVKEIGKKFVDPEKGPELKFVHATIPGEKDGINIQENGWSGAVKKDVFKATYQLLKAAYGYVSGFFPWKSADKFFTEGAVNEDTEFSVQTQANIFIGKDCVTQDGRIMNGKAVLECEAVPFFTVFDDSFIIRQYTGDTNDPYRTIFRAGPDMVNAVETNVTEIPSIALLTNEKQDEYVADADMKAATHKFVKNESNTVTTALTTKINAVDAKFANYFAKNLTAYQTGQIYLTNSDFNTACFKIKKFNCDFSIINLNNTTEDGAHCWLNITDPLRSNKTVALVPETNPSMKGYIGFKDINDNWHTIATGNTADAIEIRDFVSEEYKIRNNDYKEYITDNRGRKVRNEKIVLVKQNFGDEICYYTAIEHADGKLYRINDPMMSEYIDLSLKEYNRHI